ncbi:MAG: DNA polymerase [Desulfomonilaceae bacterium]
MAHYVISDRGVRSRTLRGEEPKADCDPSLFRLNRVFQQRKIKSRMVMVIHDALWVESPEDEAEHVRHLVWKMMTTADKFKVPLEVEIG